MLKNRRLGIVLANDTVAHLEFFYNTLLMNHNTDNPFAKPEQYPALLYKEGESPDSLLDIHRKITYPQEFLAESSIDSKSVSSLSKKYDWYPNRMLESPYAAFTESPSPKKFNPSERRQTQHFSL
jgi:hypothetical protein